MKRQYLTILENSPLFAGIGEKDIQLLLERLIVSESVYQKGEWILTAGSPLSSAGIVLYGRVHIVREDFWGNKSILAEIGEGELFGETYALIGTEPLAVSAEAMEETRALFFNIRELLKQGNRAVGQADFRLLQNMLCVLAEKNIVLSQKIEHISKKAIREKLLSYLSWQSERSKGPSFEIPFNRQQLADYLCVDRSALSSVLSRLRDEGVVDFNKNRFVLKMGEETHG